MSFLTDHFDRAPLKTDRNVNIFSDSDFYWELNIPVEQLRALEARLASDHLLEACAALGIPADYVVSYQRADFIYFLPARNEPDFTVLDLGSGFGNITIPLAKRLPKAVIHAVDASLDILSFLNTRARKEGCENIVCSKVDIFEKRDLPFKEKSFDLILMNGVLEWIGSGVLEGDPREIQKQFLAYARTLLKDDGVLYIGIEGRFFPGHFRNIPDPHTRLRYTSVVPRFVANIICKWHGRKEGYRTYTYSDRGYRKLLWESGFDLSDLEILYPVASYKDPFFIFSYDDRAAYRYAFEKMRRMIFPTWKNSFIYRCCYALGLEKFFAPSYLLLVGKSKHIAPRLLVAYGERVLPDIRSYQPIKVLGNLRDDGYVSFFLLDLKQGTPRFVLKIKRTDENADSVNALYGSLRAFDVDALVLPLRTSGVCQLFPYLVGEPFAPDREALRKAIGFICDIHKKTQRGATNIGEHEFKLGFTHGDYSLENIIQHQGAYRLVDFEDAELNGVQFFDCLDLLLHFFLHIEKTPQKELARTVLSPESLQLFQVYDPSVTAEAVRAAFDAFVDAKAVKFEHVRRAKYDFYRALKNDIARF